MSDLQKNLEGLKDNLDNLEKKLEGEAEELKNREEKWKKLDEEVEKLKNTKDDIIKFNVSGALFATKQSTLLRVKDTLFYKIIMSKKFDLSNEIFIDRGNKFFGIFMDYLRYDEIDYDSFNSEDLQEFKLEADYYEFVEIVDIIDDLLKVPVIMSFNFSGAYTTGGSVIGTNKLEDIKDKNLSTGICAKSPGWITFELEQEISIDRCEIGGFTGNPTYWASSNGSGAKIEVSKDGISYTNAGSIPSTYANSIVSVPLNTSERVKYIKFDHTSYLGLGYVEFFRKN